MEIHRIYNRKLLFAIYAIVLFIAFSGVALADLVDPTKSSFQFASSGNSDFHHRTLSAEIPIAFIAGGIDLAYDTAKYNDENIVQRTEFSVDGGHHWGRIGLRSYVRHGRQSVMQQDSHWQGGLYLHVDVVETDDFEINGAIVLWADRERLLQFYTPTDAEDSDISYGPGAHFGIRFKSLVINTEFLPMHDLSNFRFIGTPSLEIPITKILFFDELSLVVSGEIEYRRKSRHVDISNVNWRWKNGIKWRW